MNRSINYELIAISILSAKMQKLVAKSEAGKQNLTKLWKAGNKLVQQIWAQIIQHFANKQNYICVQIPLTSCPPPPQHRLATFLGSGYWGLAEESSHPVQQCFEKGNIFIIVCPNLRNKNSRCCIFCSYNSSWCLKDIFDFVWWRSLFRNRNCSEICYRGTSQWSTNITQWQCITG